MAGSEKGHILFCCILGISHSGAYEIKESVFRILEMDIKVYSLQLKLVQETDYESTCRKCTLMACHSNPQAFVNESRGQGKVSLGVNPFFNLHDSVPQSQN